MVTKSKEKTAEQQIPEVPETRAPQVSSGKVGSGKVSRDVPVNTEASSLMSLVNKLATDPEINPDRVQMAFDMYLKLKAIEAESEYNAAMARAQERMGPVVANMYNDQTQKNYADLSIIHEVCKPIWTSEGLSFSSYPVASDIPGHLGLQVSLTHKLGHTNSVLVHFPVDNAGMQGKVNKTPIQAAGSTLEYARRYTEMGMMDISVKGKDLDGNDVVELITDDQLKFIKEKAEKLGAREDIFLKYIGAPSWKEITLDQYDVGMDMLEQKERAGKKPEPQE